VPAGKAHNGSADSAGILFRTTQLDNGLLVLTERLPWLRSVTLGISFGLGSRDDPAGAAGFAHLFEHMVFKGTGELTARDIAVAAESLGASLNAFTDREMTVFHGRFASDLQAEVTGLLSEIVARPAFDETELDREQGVIAEEIKSSEEDPGSQSLDLMFRSVYGDHPLGVPILGSLESVASVRPAQLNELYRRRYNSATGLVVAVGEVDHEKLCAVLAEKFAAWQPQPGPARPPARVLDPGVLVAERSDISQVHACLALPAFPYPDSRRHALSVLNTALGAGMSSRLFQRLREQEGLVYSVSSFAELFGDSGLFAVHFVTDRAKLERCVSVLREELARLLRERFTDEEFERARNMTRSAVLLGLESPVARMLRMARAKLLLGRVVTVDETLTAYDRLEPGDVDRLVDELLVGSGWRGGAAGPVTDAELAPMLG